MDTLSNQSSMLFSQFLYWSYFLFLSWFSSDCPYTAFPCHDYVIITFKIDMVFFHYFFFQDSFMNGKCLVCPTSGCAQMGNAIFSLGFLWNFVFCFIGFYSVYSLGRGKMFLATKGNSPFCGRNNIIPTSSTFNTILFSRLPLFC